MAEKRTDGDAVAVWAAYASDRSTANRNAVVRHYMPLVTAMANARTAGFPGWVDKADLFQAAAVRVINAVERYEPVHGAAPRTFITICVRGAMTDCIRKMQWSTRSTTVAMSSLSAMSPGFVETLCVDDADADADDADCGGVDTVALRQAVARLPQQMRMMVRLHWFDGLTMAEVGKAMGVSEGRVSQVLTAAKTSLKKMLEEVQL